MKPKFLILITIMIFNSSLAVAKSKWVLEVFNSANNKKNSRNNRKILTDEKTPIELNLTQASCLISTKLANENSGDTRMIVCNIFNEKNKRTHQLKSIAHCPSAQKPSNNKTAFLAITDTIIEKGNSYLLKLYCNED